MVTVMPIASMGPSHVCSLLELSGTVFLSIFSGMLQKSVSSNLQVSAMPLGYA